MKRCPSARWDVSFETKGRNGDWRPATLLVHVALLKLERSRGTYARGTKIALRIASLEEYWHSLSMDGTEKGGEWDTSGMTPQQRAAAAKRRLQTQQLEQARRLMQGKGLQPAVVASMLQAQALHQQGPGAGARVTKGAAKGLDPTTTFNRCWDFDKGKCSRGSSCWYLHVEDGGKGGKSKDEAGKTRPALGE
ncbi:unnamed protein product, partial [Prorocentrum cordatum]